MVDVDVMTMINDGGVDRRRRNGTSNDASKAKNKNGRNNIANKNQFKAVIQEGVRVVKGAVDVTGPRHDTIFRDDQHDLWIDRKYLVNN